jgi:hypothetical protein
MTRQTKPGSRRFFRQAVRGLIGRVFGAGRIQTQNKAAIQAATTSAVAVTLTLAGVYQHDITSDASGVARAVNIGSAGTFVGQRKLVRFVTKAGGSDTFTMDAANIVTYGLNGPPRAISSITFNTAGQQAMFEWNGSKWAILSTNATVV